MNINHSITSINNAYIEEPIHQPNNANLLVGVASNSSDNIIPSITHNNTKITDYKTTTLLEKTSDFYFNSTDIPTEKIFDIMCRQPDQTLVADKLKDILNNFGSVKFLPNIFRKKIDISTIKPLLLIATKNDNIPVCRVIIDYLETQEKSFSKNEPDHNRYRENGFAIYEAFNLALANNKEDLTKYLYTQSHKRLSFIFSKFTCIEWFMHHLEYTHPEDLLHFIIEQIRSFATLDNKVAQSTFSIYLTWFLEEQIEHNNLDFALSSLNKNFEIIYNNHPEFIMFTLYHLLKNKNFDQALQILQNCSSDEILYKKFAIAPNGNNNYTIFEHLDSELDPEAINWLSSVAKS
jgi:hypothetical protein